MKRNYDKKAGPMLKELYSRFYLHQYEIADLLEINSSRVSAWENHEEPNFTIEQLRIMVELGINPLYCIGYGKIYLPEFEFEQVCENIQKRLKKIYEERKAAK